MPRWQVRKRDRLWELWVLWPGERSFILEHQAHSWTVCMLWATGDAVYQALHPHLVRRVSLGVRL